jgi:creatinine amidohydrolase
MRWDELTPSDFIKLREECGGFCVLPVASIERHGGHLPLGTDSFVGEEVCRRASGIEPMMVFPVLRFGVNGEAAANPGAIAFRTDTLMALLGNLCYEIARNGFRKILLFSSHGGNGYGLPFFVQQWATVPRDYMIYYMMFGYGQAARPKSLRSDVANPAAHGGVYETSAVMAAAPGLARPDQALPPERAAKLERLKRLGDLGVYTAVSYYANYPCHWAGLATGASREAGDELLDQRAARLVEAARAIKADETAPGLMREFRERQARGGTPAP